MMRSHRGGHVMRSHRMIYLWYSDELCNAKSLHDTYPNA